MQQLFPNMPQAHLLRGISDITSHLELLEEQLLVERRDGIPTYFSLVSG
jgi:hypothetical protein